VYTSSSVEANNVLSLQLILQKFSFVDLAVVLAVFFCFCGIVLWIGISRHVEVVRCIQENFDASNISDKGKRLFDVNLASYGKTLLSFLALTSNFGQMRILILDGYEWNAYIILSTYVITCFISLAVQFALFQVICFTRFNDLALRLHQNSLARNELLWPCVALLSLLDMFHLRLFPWIDNAFCQRSDGFPTLKLFLLVHIANLLQNTIITVALATQRSLNLLQFISLSCSLVLIVISIYILCVKVLYEKISLHEVVVVSKEFAERSDAAGFYLNNTMSVGTEWVENPIEVLPKDIEVAAEEQQKINAALDDLLQRRASRSLSRSASTDKIMSDKYDLRYPDETRNTLEILLKQQDKTIEILKKQVIGDFGAKPLEYIPLAIIKAELAQLMQAARDGSPFDEARLDHLIRCMEYNDEYIAQKREEERIWVESTVEILCRSLEVMRSFVPVNIASMTLQDLEAAGLSKGLAKRIMAKRCLWLIRMSQSDIAKMHVADLSGKYSPEAQNLDMIEMAAIYQWLLGVSFESDASGKKAKMRDGLKRSFKEKMGSLTTFDELVKKRNVTYKNQTGPFTDPNAVYSQEVVSSEDAFASRMSRLSFRGLTRSAFDSVAQAMLETKFRSDDDDGGGNRERDTEANDGSKT
jgi:hypothetical protein